MNEKFLIYNYLLEIQNKKKKKKKMMMNVRRYSLSNAALATRKRYIN